MLAGLVTISTNNGSVSLSLANVQSQMLRFTASPLLGNLTVSPAVGDATTYFKDVYSWENLTTGSFSITISVSAGSVALPQGRRGLMYLDGSNAPRIIAIAGSSTADPIPAGSQTLWYQAAAPAGWSAVALNDHAIKIVTDGSGGVTSGSVAYSTVFGQTATASTALS